jgi:hypothetical protein
MVAVVGPLAVLILNVVLNVHPLRSFTITEWDPAAKPVVMLPVAIASTL